MEPWCLSLRLTAQNIIIFWTMVGPTHKLGIAFRCRSGMDDRRAAASQGLLVFTVVDSLRASLDYVARTGPRELFCRVEVSGVTYLCYLNFSQFPTNILKRKRVMT